MRTLLPLFLLVGCHPHASVSHPPAASHEHGHGHGEHCHREHGHGEHAEHGHGHRAHEMPHRFEDAEAWAKRFDDPSRDAWQKPDAVIANLALPPGATVADVGAGTGYFAVRLARAVPQGKVFASDIEPDMVRYLGERAGRESLTNLVAVQGQPEGPALPQAVDVVLMVDVLHHIGHGDEAEATRVRYFETLAASLARGGRVVIVDFKPDAPEDGPGPPKRHRLAAAAVVELLGRAGYELRAQDDTTLAYQYVLQFVRRP